MTEKKYFTNPNIYATFEPAPNRIKKGFFALVVISNGCAVA
jgi:hypothetical protein